jgi:hypothetical protein
VIISGPYVKGLITNRRIGRESLPKLFLGLFVRLIKLLLRLETELKASIAGPNRFFQQLESCEHCVLGAFVATRKSCWQA